MGLEIDQEVFAEADYSLFRERLADSVAVLEKALSVPGFGQTETSVGAELEIFLMATDGRNGFLDGLRGSHSERVLRQCSAPLLTVPVYS